MKGRKKEQMNTVTNELNLTIKEPATKKTKKKIKIVM